MRLIDADKIVYSWQIDADGNEHDGVTLQSIIRKMPTINYCPNCGARMVEPQESDKCSKCKYHINPDYTRCKECGAERSDKE